MDAKVEETANKVIGAAIEVHRNLGPGFLESVYEEAVCVELSLRNISFARQITFSVDYKGHPVGLSRLDLLVEQCLPVELKAVEGFAPVHRSGPFLPESDKASPRPPDQFQRCSPKGWHQKSCALKPEHHRACLLS